MIYSGHSGVGALLGFAAYKYSETNDSNIAYVLLSAFLLGLASHYVTDSIPHGHYDLYIQKKKKSDAKKLKKSAYYIVAADIALSITVYTLLFLVLFGEISILYLFIATLGSQLPDLIMILNDFQLANKNMLVKIEQKFHGGIVHWHDKKDGSARPWSWTDSWQVLVSISAIIIPIIFR